MLEAISVKQPKTIDRDMAELISEYLSRFIPAYQKISVAGLVEEACRDGGLFVSKKGVLGCSAKGGGTWKVLFFTAEDKPTRKALVSKAAEVLKAVRIEFARPKYHDREFSRGPEFWAKLV
jgi:hypothetical protein